MTQRKLTAPELTAINTVYREAGFIRDLLDDHVSTAFFTHLANMHDHQTSDGKPELWFKVGEDLELVFATVMSRKWILSPGTDKDRECPYVVVDVEPCEEIPEGAIADSELWPADEEEE
jgi:hypothetical protein